MKKLLGLIFGCFFSFAVSGQGKFSLSVSAAAHYNLSSIRRTDFFPGPAGGAALPVDWAIRQTGEGYSVGVMARYAFARHWSLSMGIWLNQTAYKAATITSHPFVLITSDPTRQRNEQVLLLLNYRSSARRLSPYFSAGTSLNFPGVAFFAGYDRAVKAGNRRVRVQPSVAAGLHYRLNDRLSLSAQPLFSYYLPDSKHITHATAYRLSLQAQLFYSL